MTTTTMTTFKTRAKEQAIQIAFCAIRARGEELTVRGLRDELGGGSFATLGPIVAKEKERLKAISDEFRADRLERENARLLAKVAHLEELLQMKTETYDHLNTAFIGLCDRA